MPSDNHAKRLTEQGVSQMHENKFGLALETLNKAFEMNPDAMDTLIYRIICKCEKMSYTSGPDDDIVDIISDLKELLRLEHVSSAGSYQKEQP